MGDFGKRQTYRASDSEADERKLSEERHRQEEERGAVRRCGEGRRASQLVRDPSQTLGSEVRAVEAECTGLVCCSIQHPLSSPVFLAGFY